MKIRLFNNRIAIGIFLLLIIINISCEKTQKEVKIEKINLNFSDTIKEITFSQLFSDIRLIKLETNKESLFGDFNKILIHNHQIYISTGPSILIFSDNGNFVKKIEKVGVSPNEYSNIYDILFDKRKNEFQILDASLQRVIVYDSIFNYLRAYQIGSYAMNFALSNNGMTIFYCGNDNSGKNTSKISLFKDGKIKKEFISINKLKANYLHIRKYDWISYYNNKSMVSDAHNDTVYCIDGETCYPKYLINIGDKKVPDKFYSKKYNDIADFDLHYLMGSGYAYGVFGFIESKRQLYFSYDERLKDNNSPFGKIKKYYVLFQKATNEAIISNSLVDDINYPLGERVNNVIFFSQADGSVVFGLSAHDFRKMGLTSFDKINVVRKEYYSNKYPALKIYNQTKVLDNPILFIATLK